MIWIKIMENRSQPKEDTKESGYFPMPRRLSIASILEGAYPVSQWRPWLIQYSFHMRREGIRVSSSCSNTNQILLTTMVVACSTHDSSWKMFLLIDSGLLQSLRLKSHTSIVCCTLITCKVFLSLMNFLYARTSIMLWMAKLGYGEGDYAHTYFEFK